MGDLKRESGYLGYILGNEVRVGKVQERRRHVKETRMVLKVKEKGYKKQKVEGGLNAYTERHRSNLERQIIKLVK